MTPMIKTQKTASNLPYNIEDFVMELALNQPHLKNLNVGQLEQVAQIMTVQRLTDELNSAVSIAKIEYDAEKQFFLKSVNQNNSRYTQKIYEAGIRKLEQYASSAKIKLLAMTPTQADQYVYFLRQDGRAAASIRLDVSIVSSFFSFMSRRNKAVINPFRGTRARPGNKIARPTVIPTDDEIPIILENVPLFEKAIITCLFSRGFRAGALPTLTIWGTKFNARSKQKDISGELPQEAIQAIKSAGLNTHKPFSLWTDNAIKCRVDYQIEKLFKSGLLQNQYSSHDFRHYYAVSEYKKNKDIYRVSKLLFHSSIAITERYLKGLGGVDI